MALIEFRSKAAAGFYMMPASFSQVCKVWGRGYSEQGSIPPDGISHTLGRCISNIGTPPFSNIGTVRYGAERVKLRRFFIGGTQDDGVRTAQTFPRLSRPLTLLSGP